MCKKKQKRKNGRRREEEKKQEDEKKAKEKAKARFFRNETGGDKNKQRFDSPYAITTCVA